MARYFFNMHDGVSIEDAIGSEHADLQGVRSEAIESVAERLKGTLLEVSDTTAWVVNVTDELGYTVMVLALTAVVQLVKRPHASASLEID